MEYVIRDHLSNYESLTAIFALDVKISISISERKSSIVTFDKTLHNKKLWYENMNHLSFYMERVFNYDDIPIVVFSLDKNGIFLNAENYDVRWNTEGDLKGETHTDRSIIHYNRSMVIYLRGRRFIYNLKGHLEEEDEKVFFTLPILEKYKDVLEEVANGNFDLIRSDKIFFYTDNDNKINIVYDYYDSLYPDTFGGMIKNDPAKMIEEAEKLRKDPRNYIPDID